MVFTEHSYKNSSAYHFAHMENVSYYVDSCIWLNLWQKEESNTGILYWKIAKDFLESVRNSTDSNLICSGFVIKELKYHIPDEKLFNEMLLTLKRFCKLVKATNEDYALARKFEAESAFEISFFDCMHAAISNRMGFVLVTRDRKLIQFSKNYISVVRPEEINHIDGLFL